jgi:hypothetical protein
LVCYRAAWGWVEDDIAIINHRPATTVYRGTACKPSVGMLLWRPLVMTIFVDRSDHRVGMFTPASAAAHRMKVPALLFANSNFVPILPGTVLRLMGWA